MKVKGLISQFGVTIFAIFKGFIALKILVHFGDHNYALLSQYFVISIFGVQCLLLGFDAPFVSALINQPQDFKRIFNSIVHLLIFNLFLIFFGALLFPSTFSLLIWGGEFYLLLGLLLIYMVALSGNQITLLCYQTEKNFNAYSSLQILQQLFQIIALFLGYLLHNFLAVALLVIVFEIALWAFGFKYKLCISFAPHQFKQSWEWIRSNWSVACPIFLGLAMIWGLNNYGRFIIVHQFDLKALASYAATFSIAVLSGILINPICMVFFPYISENYGRSLDAAQSLISGLVLLIGFTSIIGFLLTITTELLMKIFARSDLFAGSLFVACVCVAQMAYGTARLTNLLTVVRSRTLPGLLAFTSGLIISIGTGLWLGSLRGIPGIAVSYCIGTIFAMIAIIFITMQYVKKCHPKIAIIRFVIFMVLSFLLPFTAIWISWESPWRVTAVILLVLFIYVVTSLFLLKKQYNYFILIKKIKLGGQLA